MSKGPLVAAGVVVVLFAAVTLLKVTAGHDVGGTPITADTSAHGGRQKVREFWTAYRAGTSARVAGRITEARDAYRAILELDPRHEDALYYLGNMELELGNYHSAEAAWRRLAGVNPGSARAHSRLGDLYACPDSGAPWNLATADAEYARAAELNREETGPLLRLGEVAALRGDLATALTYFDAVIGSHSRSVEAHVLKGFVAWKRGQQELAVAQFQNAVALARSPQPALPASAEGDTKQGAVPLVARRVRCRMFDDELELLASTIQTPEFYRRLDRRLKQVAALQQ